MAHLTQTFRRAARKDADISASGLRAGIEDAEKVIQRVSQMGGRPRVGLSPAGANNYKTSLNQSPRGSTPARVQCTYGEVDPEIEELRLKGRFQARSGTADRNHGSVSLPDISQPRPSSRLRVVVAQIAIVLALSA